MKGYGKAILKLLREEREAASVSSVKDDKKWDEIKKGISDGLNPDHKKMVDGILDKHRDMFKDKAEEAFDDAMDVIK